LESFCLVKQNKYLVPKYAVIYSLYKMSPYGRTATRTGCNVDDAGHPEFA